jgi:hypothetical protein
MLKIINFLKEHGNRLKERFFTKKQNIVATFFPFVACCFLLGMPSCTEDQVLPNNQVTLAEQPDQFVRKSALNTELSQEQIRSYLQYLLHRTGYPGSRRGPKRVYPETLVLGRVHLWYGR